MNTLAFPEISQAEYALEFSRIAYDAKTLNQAQSLLEVGSNSGLRLFQLQLTRKMSLVTYHHPSVQTEGTQAASRCFAIGNMILGNVLGQNGQFIAKFTESDERLDSYRHGHNDVDVEALVRDSNGSDFVECGQEWIRKRVASVTPGLREGEAALGFRAIYSLLKYAHEAPGLEAMWELPSFERPA